MNHSPTQCVTLWLCRFNMSMRVYVWVFACLWEKYLHLGQITIMSRLCCWFCQRRLTESETSHWPLISCISVTWVSPRPRPFRRLEAVFRPFTLMGEINRITDYNQFFCPIITNKHIGPIFHKTHIFWIIWHKNGIFQTHKSGEN